MLKKTNLLAILAALLLVIPVCYSLLTPYLPDGHDTNIYLCRVAEFHENIIQGVLFPQWAPDLAHGAGEPLFEFNPPMIYYIAEFWRLLGCGVVLSVNLAAVLLVLGSAGAAFLLGRFYFGSWGGWLAATAYLYSPYFAVELYVRGALAELAAFPFLALSLYGFGAYAQKRRRSYWLIGTISYAGILLSHNAAALFFTPVLLVFFALTAFRERSWNVLVSQAAGWVLGLGVSACIWIPSLVEQKYIHIDELLRGWLRYTNHFVYPHQLLYSAWGYGKSIPGDQDAASYALGWSHLVLVAVVLVIALKRPQWVQRTWVWFFAAWTAVFCFMMIPASQWIWDRIRLLQFVQFPWRMLGPVSLCIAMLIAPLGPIFQRMARWRSALFAIALALLIVPNIAHNRPRVYSAERESEWTPTRIAVRGVDPTAAAEYVPRWMTEWPIYNPQGLRVVAGQAMLGESAKSVTSWRGNITAQMPSTVELHISYFPGWTVLMDGQPVNISVTNPTGVIQLAVPSGTHRIEAVFGRTWPRFLSQAISVASLTLLLLLACREMILRKFASRAVGLS